MKRRIIFLFVAMLFLIGCIGPAAKPTRVPFPAPVPWPTSAPTSAPAATPSPIPSPAVDRTPTGTPTIAAGMMRIKLFFIAMEDNGKFGKKIGFNDSVIAVDYLIPATPRVLTASLKELLSLKDRNYGQSGLVNALAPAQLQIKEVSIVSGKAIINLTGALSLVGACDAPRAKAQIEETALQFSTVKSVSITFNGVPLEQALSGKGN